MKGMSFLRGAILWLVLGIATAIGAEPIKFEKLVTKDRYEFTGVEVLEKVADGIFIRYVGVKAEFDTMLGHGTTITRLPYEVLRPHDVSMLGGFKAEEAKKLRKEEEKAREEGKWHPLENHVEFTAYDPKKDREVIKDLERAIRK